MSRWKAVLCRVLKPRLAFMILLTFICVPTLIYLFYQGWHHSAAAYPAYVLSAYMLTAWSVRIPAAVKRVRAAIYGHSLGRRYMTDLAFRGSLSLHVSTAVNLCYALFKLGAGVYYRSLWFGAVAVYYICLTVIRALLLHSTYRKDMDQRHEYRTSRLCGCLLFLLTMALSAMAVQMVVYGRGYAYPGFLIFAAALYAFYSITMALINLVRFRKLNRPVLSASKVLGLATALVSMLSLQTAMFAAFGGEYQFQRLMNALTGGAVCLLILLMAVLMVVHANHSIERLERNHSLTDGLDQ